MNIVFKGSPNFWDYKPNERKPNKIVIHWFGTGTLESANSRFQNPAAKSSAHFGISKGRIWQWVREEDAAWHSGNGVVNVNSFGIEHDATTGHNLSEEDYQLSGQLVAELSKRHNIPLDRQHIIGHREVKNTQCPGTIDINKIISIARLILNPPTPMPIQIRKKVIILVNQVADTASFKLGVQRYVDKVLRKTNTEFNIDTYYYTIPGTVRFHTLKAFNSDNQMVVYVDPLEIGIYGRQAEVALGVEADTVCLLYNEDFIVGDRPTNPMENPITIEGFNPIQIPLAWVGTGPNSFSAQLFFAHENSHSDFYIINSEANAGLRDKTHDPNPYTSITPTPEVDITNFFADLLLELKPYWNYLGQGEIMAKVKSHKGALFVEIGIPGKTVYIGVNDADLHKAIRESGESLVEAAPVGKNLGTLEKGYIMDTD